MGTTELTLLLIIVGCSLVGITVGAFFLGWTIGAREKKLRIVEEDFAEEEVMVDRGYLLPTTGPIDIAVETHTTSIEIIPVSAQLLQQGQYTIEWLMERVAYLEALVAHKDKLRARYLRLLKQDRQMVLAILTGAEVPLTAYWKRWLHARYAIIDEFAFSKA